MTVTVHRVAWRDRSSGHIEERTHDHDTETAALAHVRELTTIHRHTHVIGPYQVTIHEEQQ